MATLQISQLAGELEGILSSVQLLQTSAVSKLQELTQQVEQSSATLQAANEIPSDAQAALFALKSAIDQIVLVFNPTPLAATVDTNTPPA